MVANQKITGTASSVPSGVAYGSGISIGIAVAGAMIFAKLMDAGLLPETAIGYSSMAILLVSSFFGSWAAAARIKRRKVFSCLICGAVYYAILLAMTALVFGGQYQGMGVTALLVAAGSICAILLEFPDGKQRTRRKRKNRYC